MQTLAVESNGSGKHSSLIAQTFSSALAAGVTPEAVAESYANDADFADAFDQACQRLLVVQLEKASRLQSRLGARRAPVEAVHVRGADLVTEATAAKPAKRAKRGRKKRQLHPNVAARAANGSAGDHEEAALKILKAAGGEGIASRTLGTQLGTAAGPVMKILIEKKLARQKGNAGATRYYLV